MRILSIVSAAGLNGAVIYGREVNRRLAARGHSVLLACLPESVLAGEGERWQREATGGGALRVLPSSLLWRSPAEVRRVADICRAEGIEVVHSHLTRANNFAAALHLLHRFPSAAHAHANHFQFHYWFHDLIIAVSRNTLSKHRRHLAGLGQRGVVLENFLDTERFRPAGSRPDALRALLGVSAGTPVVVQVGNLHRRKGQDLTRAAAEQVWRTHPEVHFAFFGAGACHAAWAADVRVTWQGQRADLSELLPHASVAVLPSRDDPMPLAALEAMACAVPLVVARVGGLTDVTAGGCAVQIPREDADADRKSVV